MADQWSSDELFARWREQVQANTEAWAKAVEELSGRGSASPIPPDPTRLWTQFMGAGGAPWERMQGMGPVDPSVLTEWKRFLDDWIAAWTRALERVMGTEAFAQALGKTLDQFLSVQAQARAAAETSSQATLSTLGLPSREQVVGLSRQLMDLEDRLENLEDALESSRSPAPARPVARAPGGGRRKAAKKPKTARRKRGGQK